MQVFGVGPVVDRELGGQADRLAVAAQQPGGDGVEGAAPDAAALRAAGAGVQAVAETPSTRRSISAAARRVKVSSRIRSGRRPWAISQATRWTSVAVLPVPAPATISSGPRPCDHGGALLGIEPGRSAFRWPCRYPCCPRRGTFCPMAGLCIVWATWATYCHRYSDGASPQRREAPAESAARLRCHRISATGHTRIPRRPDAWQAAWGPDAGSCACGLARELTQ